MKDTRDTHPPPWKELLYDFTQETTLHGIRFPTTKHTHNVRRIIWTLVILIAIGLLLFIIFNNLVKYLGHPKSVNVDVTYKPELLFPAVTLCNQNLFKSTGIFKQGMHDVLTEFFKVSENDGKCKETYTFEENNCPPIDALRVEGEHYHWYANVSFLVCSHLCSDAHSVECMAVVYDRQHKSCLLTSGMPHASSVSCHESPYELYRRNRCTGIGRELMTCDFEGIDTEDDDTGCNLRISKSQEEWTIMKIKDISNIHIKMDHTLNLDLGRVLALEKAGTRPGFTALLIVDYRFYDNMCMEFWYIQLVKEENNHVHFKVILSREHLHEEILFDSANIMHGFHDRWNKVFLKLPDGAYILKIITIRPKGSDPLVSGLLMDDISIWPCERYNRDCVWTADKSSFNGINEYTAKGEHCTPWSDLDFEWHHLLSPERRLVVEQFASSSGRSCRLPPQDFVYPHDEVFLGCYKKPSQNLLECDAKYCPCRLDQFRCEMSGLCIPAHLTCNGDEDCPGNDASDEAPAKCWSKRNVTCSFESPYMCGYKSSKYYPIIWRRKQAGDKLNEVIDVSYTQDMSSLKYILDIDGANSNEGDKALLVSPEWMITEPGFCIWFWFHMVYHEMDTEEKLEVYVVTSTVDTIPLITIRESNKLKKWKQVSAPLPLGNFTVMFEATIGFSYRSDISLDDIEVKKCTNPLLSPLKKKKRSVASSISCDFNTDVCGYQLDGTSAFVNWQRVPIEAATSEPPSSTSAAKASCNKEFMATTGTFQTPKFPEFYPKQKCTNTFKAHETSTIRITFKKVHVGTGKGDDNKCPGDKITVTDAIQDYSDNSSALTDSPTTTDICGIYLDSDLVFVSVGNEMKVTFTALSVSTLYEGFRAKYEISEPSPELNVNYILMMESSLAGRGDKEAQLISPRFEPHTVVSCLEVKISKGPVLIMALEEENKRIPMLTTNVEMPAGLTTLQVQLPGDVERIMILGLKNKAALDDIIHEPGECGVPTVPTIDISTKTYMCDFKNDDCNFKNTAEYQGKWLRSVKKNTQTIPVKHDPDDKDGDDKEDGDGDDVGTGYNYGYDSGYDYGYDSGYGYDYYGYDYYDYAYGYDYYDYNQYDYSNSDYGTEESDTHSDQNENDQNDNIGVTDSIGSDIDAGDTGVSDTDAVTDSLDSDADADVDSVTTEPSIRRKRAVRNRRISNTKHLGRNKRFKEIQERKRRKDKFGVQGHKSKQQPKPRRLKRAVDDPSANKGDSKEVSYVLACGSDNITAYPCELMSPWIITGHDTTCLHVRMRAADDFVIIPRTQVINDDHGTGYQNDGVTFELHYAWEWKTLNIPIQRDGARVILKTGGDLDGVARIEIDQIKISPGHKDCTNYQTADFGNDQYYEYTYVYDDVYEDGFNNTADYENNSIADDDIDGLQVTSPNSVDSNTDTGDADGIANNGVTDSLDSDIDNDVTDGSNNNGVTDAGAGDIDGSENNGVTEPVGTGNGDTNDNDNNAVTQSSDSGDTDNGDTDNNGVTESSDSDIDNSNTNSDGNNAVTQSIDSATDGEDTIKRRKRAVRDTGLRKRSKAIQKDSTAKHRVARQIVFSTDDDSAYENTKGNDEIILSNTMGNTRKAIEADISIADLYQVAKHELEDLIFSCTWKNKPCDLSWFTQEVTELGVCHTFNFNRTNPMTTDLTGSFNGLSIVLNVEKYDHTVGVNSDAGIKLHLHDQNDVPSVSDTGIAIALSTHTLIEMRYSRSKTLGDPYGDCGTITLDYFPDEPYTYARCQRQCRSKQLEAQCNCRDAYMPETSGKPVCSVDKYLDCALRFYTNNQTGNHYECPKCPDACKVITFATEMSFASLSELSALELISDPNKHQVLHKRFYEARESMARSDPTYIVSAINQLEHVIHQLQDTLEYTTNHAPTSHTSFSSFAIKAVSSIVRVLQNDVKKTLTDRIANIIGDYDISYGMAVEDLIAETRQLSRDMTNIVNLLIEQEGKQADVPQFHDLNNLKTLIQKTKDDDSTIKFRRSTYTYVPRRLYKGPKEEEESELAMEELIRVAEGFIEVLNNITDPNENVTKADIVTIAKKHQNFTTASIKMEKYVKDYSIMLEDISYWLRTDDYANGRITQITSELETTLDVELLKHELEIQVAFFKDLYQRYAINEIDHHKLSTTINDDLSQRMDTFLSIFQEGILDKYLGRITTAVETINIEVVEGYEKVLEYLTELNVHFEPQSGTTFEDNARSMDIWRMPYTRHNAIESIQYRLRVKEYNRRWPMSRDLTSFTTNNGSHTVLKFIMAHYFESVSTVFADFEATVKAFVTVLQGDIKQLVESMNAFRLGSIIDPKFVVDNFLKLDIYYGELKYEFIEQTPSYELVDFFSDMGGYMGLLLGASVMTVCEVFDLFLYQSIMKMIAAGKRSRKVGSASSINSVVAWPEKK